MLLLKVIAEKTDGRTNRHLFVLHLVTIVTRAPIDQPFSRESSASLNLVGDRSEHPVYDHLPVRSPRLSPTQADAVSKSTDSAPHYSPGLVDCNLTLMPSHGSRVD